MNKKFKVATATGDCDPAKLRDHVINLAERLKEIEINYPEYRYLHQILMSRLRYV